MALRSGFHPLSRTLDGAKLGKYLQSALATKPKKGPQGLTLSQRPIHTDRVKHLRSGPDVAGPSHSAKVIPGDANPDRKPIQRVPAQRRWWRGMGPRVGRIQVIFAG